MKIIYTVGPQCVEIPDSMIFAGADGARLTFSYGTPDIQRSRALRLRESANERSHKFEIVADLEGGGLRLGEVSGPDGLEFLPLRRNENIAIVADVRSADLDVELAVLPIPDNEAFNKLSEGMKICIGDGSAIVEVTQDRGDTKVGRIEFDCEIEGRRSFFIQGAEMEPVCLTDKDIAALQHIASHRADYDAVALSFVGTRADVAEAKHILGGEDERPAVIAKIETPSGVSNIKEICEVADSIMIARGDLALTQDWRELARSVDTVVEECNRSGTPWILATQVADGVMHGAMLSRAEICDMWFNMERGAAGFLLSRETAWGSRPAEAVRQCRNYIDYWERKSQ